MSARHYLKEIISIKFQGNQTAFARAIGKSQAQVNQWVKGYRNLSQDTLRFIEERLNLPYGWMDGKALEQQPGQIQNIALFTPSSVDAGNAPAGDIRINHYDAAGSMGRGLILRDQPGIIQTISVNKEWLQKNVKTYSHLNNLCVVTGFGDSMQPLFNSGDPLLMDAGVKTVEYDGVYFFRIGDEGYIKRLQRIPTENGLIIRAKSDNKEKYDPFEITEKMDFEVFGVILKAWQSSDL